MASLLIPRLDNFRSQGYDLHKAFFTQFASHRAKNTRTFGVLAISVQNHSRIVIKADGGTIFTAPFFGSSAR